jgi:uncharacterized membrane-anchored protein
MSAYRRIADVVATGAEGRQMTNFVEKVGSRVSAMVLGLVLRDGPVEWLLDVFDDVELDVALAQDVQRAA